jgi:hypothetical protein
MSAPEELDAPRVVPRGQHPQLEVAVHGVHVRAVCARRPDACSRASSQLLRLYFSKPATKATHLARASREWRSKWPTARRGAWRRNGRCFLRPARRAARSPGCWTAKTASRRTSPSASLRWSAQSTPPGACTCRQECPPSRGRCCSRERLQPGSAHLARTSCLQWISLSAARSPPRCRAAPQPQPPPRSSCLCPRKQLLSDRRIMTHRG